MKPPKCKFCPNLHWGICPKPSRTTVKAQVASIQARVVLPAKPKKAKKKGAKR